MNVLAPTHTRATARGWQTACRAAMRCGRAGGKGAGVDRRGIQRGIRLISEGYGFSELDSATGIRRQGFGDEISEWLGPAVAAEAARLEGEDVGADGHALDSAVLAAAHPRRAGREPRHHVAVAVPQPHACAVPPQRPLRRRRHPELTPPQGKAERISLHPPAECLSPTRWRVSCG